MKLFDEGRTDEYLNLNSDKIKKEIYQMSDEEIMTCRRLCPQPKT